MKKSSEPIKDKDGYTVHGFDPLMCLTVEFYRVVIDHSQTGKDARTGQDVRSLYNGGRSQGRQADLFDAQTVMI